MKLFVALFSGLLCLTTVLAQSQYCSSDGICVAVTVPTANIASGNPNLLITLQAPASDKWFAVGFGSQMAGTLMLVVWPYNNQVIASARLATGHSLPPPYSGPQVVVLSSNVTTTETTVQLECLNCTTWSTGKLDVQSTSGNFIYAYGNQEPATPNVPTSTFTQHLDHGNFNLNLKAAQLNTASAPTITGSAKSSGSSGGLFGLSQRQLIILVHGVMMGLIWVLLFPLGAVIIRFLGNVTKNAVGKHRIVQISALVLLLIATGVGVYLAWGHQFTAFHHFFGVSIVGAAVVQAGFGAYHHARFVKDRPTHRRWFTHVHLWLGRTVILCGVANCGFGLLIANQPFSAALIWWIGCGALAVAYFFGYVIMRWVQRRRGRKAPYVPAPGYELNPYERDQEGLLRGGAAPGAGGRYSPPVLPPVGFEGGYSDRAPEPYDPPRRYDEPVARYGSPSGSRQALHLDP